MTWLDAAVMLFVAGLGLPILWQGVEQLIRIRRGFRQQHEDHATHMEGFAAGADFDERDRREALRRRLRLER